MSRQTVLLSHLIMLDIDGLQGFPFPSQINQPSNQNIANNEILQNQENKEIIIGEIMNMGFDRAQIEQALVMAFYNKDRAIDYLLNGIPENLINQVGGTVCIVCL